MILESGGCIKYGDKTLDALQVVPALPLVAGKAYGLSINASVERRSSSEVRRYRAYFCLINDAEDAPTVRQVQWDEQASQWQWDSCGPTLP